MRIRLPGMLAAGALALLLGTGSARADHHGTSVPAEPTACSTCCPASCGFFYAGVEGLYWHRSKPRSIALLNDDQGTVFDPEFGIPLSGDDTPVFNARDLDLGYEPGFRVTAGWQMDDCNGIVFIFTDVGDWETEDVFSNANTVGNLIVPFDDPLFSFSFVDVTDAIIRSWSELHTGEIMFTRKCGSHLTLLAGVRYVHEDENLEILTQEAFVGAAGFIGSEAENHILALQVGAYGSCCVTDRLSIDATVKVAGGMNFARMHNTIIDDVESVAIGATVLRDAQDTREKVSFVGEVGVFATYRVSDRCAVRGGYQALYLTGVALAPEQLDFGTDASSGTRVNVDGDILYHGGSVGVMFSW